jgi:hypothetical protein
MISINHNNKNYIKGDYILSNTLVYSKGCRTSRDIIKKKNVTNTDFIYAREKDNEWVITDGNSAKMDKVFFSKTFLETIPELNN